MDPSTYPDFDDLPKVEGQPQGCAWGVFDKDGKKDVFGTLNFLTPKIVAAAGAEVKDGVSISLNWPLNGLKIPLPGRKPPIHTPLTLRSLGMEVDGWDEELTLNTQFSTQWDSLCHMTPNGVTYNDARPTQSALEAQSSADNALPTIEHWHARGGLVGRGVLIDFKRYWEETKGKGSYHPLDGYRITPEDVEAVARHQGVEFRHGDILIVRTGYTEILERPTAEDMAKFGNMSLSGMDGTRETARWVWNKRFAAVAGDAHAFEALPVLREDGSVGEVKDVVLHKWFLNMFGMPIGELWDLKALGEYAKKTGRYSFLLTSVPLNHPCLVASPANAVAVF